MTVTEQDPKLVELPVRFSESRLWGILQNYFTSKGIEAWKNEVPFYISSNAFIAHHYAMLVINRIQDWRKQNPGNQECFYIAEIGSGMGRFAFYFMKAFKELLLCYGLKDQKFCYILTDLIEGNVQFCKENKSFAPYVASGEIDFACFNVANDKDFFLLLKNQSYASLRVNTPLIVIANYVFDCVKQDAFIFQDGNCHELKLGLHSRYKHFDSEKALHISDLRLEFYEGEAEDTNVFYEDPFLNGILKHYQEHFDKDKAYLLMPLGAIAFIQHMKELSHGQFFMIVGDKGVTHEENLKLLNKNQLASFDGCYSFMVNFHALGMYCSLLEGDAKLTQHQNDFQVNLFSMGSTFSDLMETKAYFDAVLENNGPSEYCQIYSEYLANSYRFQLPSLLAFLRFSQYDPYAYDSIHDRLITLLPTSNLLWTTDIRRDLKKVEDNLYQVEMGEDVYCLLGFFYEKENIDDKAIQLYELSMEVFPKKAQAPYRLAKLYEKQKNIQKAIEYYQKAYKLDKNNRKAKQKCLQLSGKFSFAFVRPLIRGLFVVILIGLVFYLLKK